MGLIESERSIVPVLLVIAVVAAMVWLVIKRFTQVVQAVFVAFFGLAFFVATKALRTEVPLNVIQALATVQFFSFIYAVVGVLAIFGRVKKDVFAVLSVFPLLILRIFPEITLGDIYSFPLPLITFGVFGLATANA